MLNKVKSMSVWAKLMGVFIFVGIMSAIAIVITDSIHAYVITFMSVLLTCVMHQEKVIDEAWSDYYEEEEEL